MRLLLGFVWFLPAAYPQAAGPRVFRLEELRTPPGYEVSVYATAGGSPRHMTFGPNGVLYVATRGNGRVVAIPEAGRTVTVLQGLNGPHTLEFRGAALWIGANDAVLRFRDAVTSDLVIRTQAERVVTLPAGGQHSTRTIGFGPDGGLYVSLGSTCNFCVEGDRRRAAIVRYDADGRNEALFATGLRNTVGFTFHPVTGEMWGTDHGGDGLGDNEPPEEINRIERGADYGWPDCIGNQRGVRWGNQARPDRCGETRAPAFEMQGHSAPLGIAFYTGDQFPAAFKNDALVTLHGSWNRSEPAGYKVVRIRWAEGKPVGEEDFLWGFLNFEARTRSGRPVHAIPGPDGAVYVSDDGNGSIYRVAYTGPRINEGGVVRVVENAYAIYGARLGSDVQVFANGLAAEVLYASDGQVNFLMPLSLRGPVTVQVKNAKTVDEAVIAAPE